MEASVLRDRVLIEDFTASLNSYREKEYTWAEYITVWAQVKYQSTFEVDNAQQVLQKNMIEVCVRRSPDSEGITHRMRLTHDGQTYGITGVEAHKNLREYMIILAEARIYPS